MADDVRAHLSENIDLAKQKETTAVPCIIADKESFFNWGAEDDNKSILNRMDDKQVLELSKIQLIQPIKRKSCLKHFQRSTADYKSDIHNTIRNAQNE